MGAGNPWLDVTLCLWVHDIAQNQDPRDLSAYYTKGSGVDPFVFLDVRTYVRL